jgi:hypothetical protein
MAIGPSHRGFPSAIEETFDVVVFLGWIGLRLSGVVLVVSLAQITNCSW